MVWGTFAFAAVTAGLTGYLMGRSADQTAADIAAAAEASSAPSGELGELIAGEGTRVIRNMWLSEILEQQR